MSVVTIEEEAGEAILAAKEYADWIRNLETTKDERARRTPEVIANMKIRLLRKQAIALRYERLLERQKAQAEGAAA